MLSLLLITAALTVQNPPPASKPATAATRSTAAAAVSRMAFHDRMRELWTDHITYTRSFIVSASAGLADTSEVSQRLLRNQDEIGDTFKPYYGDETGTQLASLLRSHIQHAAKALAAAKGNTVSMQAGMKMQDTTGGYVSGGMSENRDTVQVKASAQYPTGRMNTDTTKGRAGSQANAPANVRIHGDNANVQAQSQVESQVQGQVGQVDSTALNQAVAALRANGDSIATLLATANPRGFSRETLKGAMQMHINLLLQEATAQLKRDWNGSITAFDQSLDQGLQMADVLSEGIMKQFPSRFSNKATTISSR